MSPVRRVLIPLPDHDFDVTEVAVPWRLLTRDRSRSASDVHPHTGTSASMTIRVPGVSIAELPSLTVSVSTGATAVPVFAAGANSGITQTTRINTFLDFTHMLGDLNPKQTLHVALRSYFENGGGYCYLVPTEQWTTEVPKLEDVTLLVAAGQDVLSQVLELCVPGESLFALLDGPNAELTNENVAHLPSTEHAAAYYPWLAADWAETPIPPSAAVAGVYCQVDRQRGVFHAPANVSLKGDVRPLHPVSDDLQARYTTDDKSINMLRELNSRGTLLWGARTLAANSGNCRYIPVRRLFDMVERDVRTALRGMIFESNSATLWEKVRLALENYLHNIWKQGGLMGSRPEESYFVQIGETLTMNQEDIANGLMRVRVGLAAVRPAEFIVLEFTQDVGAT